MRITQVLSLLYLLATSWGFAPDNQRTPNNRHHPTAKNVFRRERNNASNNKFVYLGTDLSQAAFIPPIDGADASDVVVVETQKRKKRVTASSSKAVLPPASKQRQRRVEVIGLKSRQTLSGTTKPVKVKSDETKLPSRRRIRKQDKVQWNSCFEQLVKYKQQYGDCLVPMQFQKNLQLGQWVKNQRYFYKQVPKEISDERIQRLEGIGFVWSVYNAQWELHFEELVEYKQQHGNCLVPNRFQENLQLGKWVNTQRYCHNQVPKMISDERIQRLDDIGFEWDARQSEWESLYKELLEYKQQHGNCLVPYRFQENPELGHWVKNQRTCYNGEPKSISNERIQRLENVGFAWDGINAQWELRFNQILEYKQQHGDCLVPVHYQENPELGYWVTYQRQSYKQVPKEISDEYIKRLDDVGFEWDVHKAHWELRFKELLEYKQQHGNCLVPRQLRKNPELGRWVCSQRQLYKQVPKMLSEEYTQRLNDIGFAWVGRYMRWEEGFEALLEYKQQHGNCWVPQWFRENPLLARWVRYQRYCYKSEPKQITDKRIRRLDYVGFVWDVNDAKWDLRFQELVEYKQQHGDCLVPRRFQESKQHLAYWVGYQRKCYRSEPKKISDERIQRLESIGFVWDVRGIQ